MSTYKSNLDQVISLWKGENPILAPQTFQYPDVSEIIASFFAPGPYYYYIFNFYNHCFEYVHPNIRQVLGYEPEAFDLDLFFAIMNAEDMEQMKWKEAAAAEFLFRRIPPEKLTSYKVCYSFRLRSSQGIEKNILHQVITLTLQEDKIHYVLGVHTDISHLQGTPDNRISFIGLKGEPSYYSLNTAPDALLAPAADIKLSNREKEIVRMLAEGLSSKQIGDKLFISPHTVDTHRRHLLSRTQTSNTLELVAVCLRRGII